MTKLVCFICLLFIPFIAFSQTNDAGLWLNVSIEKKFTQAFSIEYNNSIRFNENFSELESEINELGLNYKFNKNSKVSAFYRFTLKNQLNSKYIPVSRFYVDYTQSFDLWVFDISVRCRMQTQQKNVNFYDFDSDSRNIFRPRIKIEYDILKYSPYIFVETFHPVLDYQYSPLSKLRCVAGIEYAINNKHICDLGYMIQKEFYQKNPETNFVFRVAYKFRF